MIRFRLILVAILCIAPLLDVVAQQQPALPLPVDPSATVIMMTFRGGMPPPPSQNMNRVLTDFLTVRADGRATVAGLERNLSATQFQDLLRFIVTDQNFFAIDMAKDVYEPIAAESRQTNRWMIVADAGETVIRIKTADNEKEISFNALNMFATKYPAITALQRLQAVQNKLLDLAKELQSGEKLPEVPIPAVN